MTGGYEYREIKGMFHEDFNHRHAPRIGGGGT